MIYTKMKHHNSHRSGEACCPNSVNCENSPSKYPCCPQKIQEDPTQKKHSADTNSDLWG